jgi:hypothetical protein
MQTDFVITRKGNQNAPFLIIFGNAVILNNSNASQQQKKNNFALQLFFNNIPINIFNDDKKAFFHTYSGTGSGQL